MSSRIFLLSLLASAGCEAGPAAGLETSDAGKTTDTGLADSTIFDAGTACSADGFDGLVLQDHLVVTVKNAVGDAIAGATIIIRRDGMQLSEGVTDVAGCAEFVGQFAPGVAVEVRAPNYAPATRLSDPLALQRFGLSPVAPRITAPASTGVITGSIPNLELAGHTDALEIRADVYPILSSPWVRGMEQPELIDNRYFENSVYSAMGREDLEFRLVPRAGEHRGFSVMAGYLDGALFPPEFTYGWMGWTILEVGANETVPNLALELTVPLVHEGRIELQDTAIPRAPRRTGFLEIPDIGIMYLPGEGLRGEIIKLPRLEGFFAEARLGAYARDELDLDGGFYDRVAYAETGTTTIVFSDNWIDLDVFGVRGDTINFSQARSREQWTICQISILGLENTVLAEVIDFSGERTVALPTKPGTSDRIDLPEQVKIDVRCERYPGWVPGSGARDIYLEHRWYRTSEHDVR